jgi:hypothetical protein
MLMLMMLMLILVIFLECLRRFKFHNQQLLRQEHYRHRLPCPYGVFLAGAVLRDCHLDLLFPTNQLR